MASADRGQTRGLFSNSNNPLRVIYAQTAGCSSFARLSMVPICRRRAWAHRSPQEEWGQPAQNGCLSPATSMSAHLWVSALAELTWTMPLNRRNLISAPAIGLMPVRSRVTLNAETSPVEAGGTWANARYN